MKIFPGYNKYDRSEEFDLCELGLTPEYVHNLPRRDGYRYIDWYHGCSLLTALELYGDIEHLVKRFRRSRSDLIKTAMEFSGWLDIAEKLAGQNPHIWRHPGTMDDAPPEVPTILSALRKSLLQKLKTGELHALGYFEICGDPDEWPLVNVFEDPYFDDKRSRFGWDDSSIQGNYYAVRITQELGESILLPEAPVISDPRGRGRPGIEQYIRSAFTYAANQSLIIPHMPKAKAYGFLRPLAVKEAYKRNRKIKPPSDEALRKHTVDLFEILNSKDPKQPKSG